MMLCPHSFTAKYGPINQIPYVHQADREIYQGRNFVVKVGMLHEMLIELSCYSTYRHPGIVQLYNWTLAEDGRIRLALECGIPLDQNSRLNSSELQILISDLISVCSFLHTSSRPLVHGDIKPENLVKIEDHYKLIDFGNAINGYFDAGEVRYCGTAYTESYRAAEYHPLVPHTARVETFSVGKTVAKLASGQGYEPLVSTFIENTTKVASKDRVQIIDLQFPRLQGIRCGFCLPSVYSGVLCSDPGSKVLWYKCVSELIKQSRPLDVSLRTFFLALSNCRRCFAVMTIQGLFDNIELYSMAHLAMALSLIQGEPLPESIELHLPQDKSSVSSLYREMLRVLLTHLKGQLYVSTYWDVVDNESLHSGLIQEMSYVRHLWGLGQGNARHRVYSSFRPHILALSQRYQVDLLRYQSIQELCERPLSPTAVPSSHIISYTSCNAKS